MTEIAPADPLVREPQPAPADSAASTDFPAHVRTYNAFLHLVKWFILHAVFLVPALYCLIIAGQPVGGAFLLIIAAVILGYGVVSLPSAGRDISRALDPQNA